MSYMTYCGHSEDGPGTPMNIWFDNDHCDGDRETAIMEPHGQCMGTWAKPYEQIYGGARMYISPLFGRMRGDAYREFCFEAGDGNGPNPADKLTPWNTYKDINVLDKSGSKGDEDGMSCYGEDCMCDGTACMTHKSKCSGEDCLCMGPGCTCSMTTGCTTQYSTLTSCMGTACGCQYGDECVFTGNVHYNGANPERDYHCDTDTSTGETYCTCAGKDCGCTDWSCNCLGNDCGCEHNNVNCIPNYVEHTLPSDQTCAGHGCMCTDGCALFGRSDCMDPECSCFGPNCEG